MNARILSVDDNPTNLKLLRAQLEANGDTVFDASDGVAALAVLQQHPVDAVISDVLMPKMDGYRLCYEMRKRERFKDLPFVIYTATYTSPSDEKLALDIGADKYLRKPATAETIVAALQEVLHLPLRQDRAPRKTLPEAELMKVYSERLVNKLEETNIELTAQTEALQATEKQLKASLKKVSELTLALDEHAIVAITDPQGRITYVNDKFCVISKYSREELLGQDQFIVNSGYNPKEFIRGLWITIKDGRVWHGEVKCKTKDGAFYWVDTTIVPFLNEQGKPRQYVAIQVNITQRKQGEQMLRASEISYRRLFEAAKDGILILDVDTGRISEANPFLVELLGSSHSEMLGKTVGELSPFKDIESNEVMLKRLQKDRYVRYEDLPLQTRDGRHIAVEFISNVYQAGDHDVIQCNIRDITERKRAEEQMRGMQTQLEQTNRDLTKKTEEIQYFYHTLSHELKTPLTAAREFVSIVIDGLAGELNSTQLNYLRIAKKSCTELAVYINDLLDATRLDTGKLHIELKAVSLAAIIQRAIAIMKPVATGKKIRLSDELDTDLMDVMVDESRIMQILTNLLNNALKFTFEGGEIIVKLGEDPKNSEYVQISVTDTGCGIPKDQIDNLFHRFYQIKNGDATPEKGVGLGLYLCREMVLLHGGNIWVESTLGRGSTFSFTIPKRAATKNARVLVVDDDADLRDAMRSVLEYNGFDVATVAGGTEALQWMGQKTPDVVVLDLMMLGLDGPSTLKEIRKKFGQLPVIVHTGYPDGDLMQQALESSPFTLLAKPCPPERFVETVRRIYHNNVRIPKEKKCLAVTRSAPPAKPFREAAPGTKPLTQIKPLLVAEDDKEVALRIKASNGGQPDSIAPLNEGINK